MPEEKKIPKGNRERNYSDLECIEMIRLIKKYASIIECKKHGRYKNEERNLAWDSLCREFNMNTSQVRWFFFSQNSQKQTKNKNRQIVRCFP